MHVLEIVILSEEVLLVKHLFHRADGIRVLDVIRESTDEV